MRKRDYKRNSIKSQRREAQELAVSPSEKQVSSHSYYVAYTLYLGGASHSGNHSIWFEDIKGGGIPCFLYNFLTVLYHCLYQNSAGEEQRDLSAHFGTSRILGAVMSCVFQL